MTLIDAWRRQLRTPSSHHSSSNLHCTATAVAWVTPEHPGAHLVHGANATAAQITEINRLFNENLERFHICKATGTALKKQLLEAVPATFTLTLKNDLFGYANVTVLEILYHLDTQYGKVDQEDLKEDFERMGAAWSPTQPIEDLFNQIKAAQLYAAAYDPITNKTAIRAATTNLANSEVFTEALREWKTKMKPITPWQDLNFTSRRPTRNVANSSPHPKLDMQTEPSRRKNLTTMAIQSRCGIVTGPQYDSHRHELHQTSHRTPKGSNR
ncbi:hypothetical protein SEMRO_1708_G292670.1 [Seminavis robusta]|uniref:Uncharacterized protein n=1 Tax=Seminavis robusta TaxID=568900 RepID=A0A9N8EQZ2_9STRA|nr:hypothetical protein SEMRO_1708_G292670.1 [Seminavis robusta]|eukprot:Sro1708_g292670.1 n/a (270) ;mRNA; r:5141-6072